jgi:hypothetical protein
MKKHPGFVYCEKCEREIIAGLGFRIHSKDCKGKQEYKSPLKGSYSK